jgi:hypothetical protein
MILLHCCYSITSAGTEALEKLLGGVSFGQAELKLGIEPNDFLRRRVSSEFKNVALRETKRNSSM